MKYLIVIFLFVAETISCLNLHAQNQFYSADIDNPTGTNKEIKKGFLVERINDTTIRWGINTVNLNTFKAFTKAEFSNPDLYSKIKLVKNELDSSLYINNKSGKILISVDLQDSIKNNDYFKLKNFSLDSFTLFYNDTVTLVKSNGKKVEALVTIPLIFDEKNYQLKYTLKRGPDSLAISKEGKYLFIENDNIKELNFYYNDSLLAKILTDSTLLYSYDTNYPYEYLIFDADKIPTKQNIFSAVYQWLKSGMNWLWLVIGLIVVGGIVFVVVLILQKKLIKRKIITNDISGTDKVKFLRKEDKKAVFQLTIADDNKEKLLKKLSIKQDDIQQTDNVIEVTIALSQQPWGKEKDLQKLNKWVENRCSVELFYKINDLSDYRALEKGKRYLVPEQNKLAILEKYAEIPTPTLDIEKQEKLENNIISTDKNPGGEKELETQTQIIEFTEEKSIEVPKINTSQIEEPKLQSLFEKFQAFIDRSNLDNEDESKIKETFNSLKSLLLEFQTELSNTESENNSAIHSYSQQIEEFKKEQEKLIEDYKTAFAAEKEKALKENEQKIRNEYIGVAREEENKLLNKLKENETEIANLIESHKKALLEKEEENQKRIEKIAEERNVELAKKEDKINKIKKELDEIKEKTENEWKLKLKQKENAFIEEQNKLKTGLEKLIKEKAEAIANERKNTENAVKAEKEKAKRYHDNVIFADELKPYASKVLLILEMGQKLQTESNKLYQKEKGNKNATSILNNAFAKFQTATFNLKIGDWREQLNNIVFNGAIIVPPAGKENNHSSVYATIRQAIKEGRAKEQQIEAFQDDIAIALLNRYCGALLVLVEDMKVLAENKISIPREIDELRKTLRGLITKELSLKINDIALLEKLNNNGEIEVIDEISSLLTKDEERVVEVLSYGVGRDRVDKTKVIISK